MDTDQSVSVLGRNARVLGAAGVLAGIAGGLTGLAVQGKRQPTAVERVQGAAGQLSSQDAPSAVTDTLKKAGATAAADFRNAAPGVESSKRRVLDNSASARESASSVAEHMRHTVNDGAERISKKLPYVADQALDVVERYADGLSDRASAQTEQRRKDAMKFRKDAAKRGEERMQELNARAQDTLESRIRPNLEKAGAATGASANEIRKRIGEEAKDLEKRYAKASPKVKKSATQALARLEDEARDLDKRYESAKPRLKAGATEVRKRLEDEARDLERRYEKARPRIEESAERYAERATKLGGELFHTAEERAQSAEHVFEDSTDQARMLVHNAGESAKQGGRNLGSLLFWGTVAGGLVYIYLLNEEQRKKARELAGSAFREGKEIYDDVRGQNADFQSQQQP